MGTSEAGCEGTSGCNQAVKCHKLTVLQGLFAKEKQRLFSIYMTVQKGKVCWKHEVLIFCLNLTNFIYWVLTVQNERIWIYAAATKSHLRSSSLQYRTAGKQIKTHKCQFCSIALSIPPRSVPRGTTSQLRLHYESACHLLSRPHHNYKRERNGFIRRTYAKESNVFNAWIFNQVGKKLCVRARRVYVGARNPLRAALINTHEYYIY